MTHAHCLDGDQIAAAHEARAGEEAAVHLLACARCRARVAEYAAFVQGAPVADESRVRAAADAMTRALAARLDAEAAPAPLPLPSSRRPAFSWMALAAAAALVVVAGATFTLLRAPAPGASPDAVRGPSAGAATFVLRAPQMPTGQLRLEWEPVAGADGYELRFFGADLVDRARVTGLSVNGWTAAADSLPAGLAHGERVLVEVQAMANGERIATSEPLPVVVP